MILMSDIDMLAIEIDRIKSRLSALENIIACDGIDARLHQPSALEQQPAETEREWTPFQQKLVRGFWVYWSDRDITLEGYVKAVKDYSGGTVSPTHIMPYHPGDPKPEAPREK